MVVSHHASNIAYTDANMPALYVAYTGAFLRVSNIAYIDANLSAPNVALQGRVPFCS